MSSRFHTVTSNFTAPSDHPEAPFRWNWKIVYGLALTIVSIAQVFAWTRYQSPCLRKFFCQWITTLIHNLYLHPLAKFPGPFLGRASLLWRFMHTSTGKIHLSIAEMHQKYGFIVRISPNELSFGSVESWKSIYGHGIPHKPIPVKAAFYDVFGAGFSRRCIGSERDPHRHGEMRKMLSPAFSQRSLLEQESIIGGVIDQFVQIIGEKAPPGSNGINLTKWYEMVSFDILGEMAFGESFHSLESGKPHFWADIILEHLYFITIVDNLRRIRVIATLFRYLMPSSVLLQNQNSRYSRNQVEKRLASKQSRKDFVSLLAHKVQNGEVEKEEMTAHVSTLTIAGGETVSTILAGITCFLLQHPEKLDIVVSEIRGAFKSYDDINARKAQQLQYLQAIINEGLRIFPPNPQGSPRVSPGFELHGRYVPEGAEIYTSSWTVTHDPQYFAEPMKFYPERWLEPNSSDTKEASQPFSVGPRACIGRNFALMEMNLLMAKLFWTYELELVNREINWLGEGKVHVLWWKPNLFVRFHKRLDLS